MTPTRKPIQENEPALHAINIIHVDGKGFVYKTHDDRDAAAIVVKPGDQVKWNSGHGNYSVLFQAGSPFDDIGAHGKNGSDTVSLTVVGAPGRYKYAVSVALPNGVVVDDPEIIVDESGN